MSSSSFQSDVWKQSEGEEALTGLRFHEDAQGLLWVWKLPEEDDDVEITDRYLTVVDVGGRTEKADWSDIVVLTASILWMVVALR